MRPHSTRTDVLGGVTEQEPNVRMSKNHSLGLKSTKILEKSKYEIFDYLDISAKANTNFDIKILI